MTTRSNPTLPADVARGTSTAHPSGRLGLALHDRPLWSRADRAVVVGLMVVVAVAASWRLSAASLWVDEASTWAISGHGFGDLVRALAHSEANAGGLYLVVIHWWLQLWGDSETGLRSLSVVCAVLSVPAFFAVARRLLDPRTARASLVIFACNPFLLTYGRHARMYVFALLLCLAATYCFLRLVDDQHGSWWLAYALTASAAVYAHAFSLLVIGAHLCSLLCLPRRSVNWSRVLRAFGGVLLLILPLLAYTQTTNLRGVDWITPFSLQQMNELMSQLDGSPRVLAPLLPLAALVGAGVVLVRTFRHSGRSRILWTRALPVWWWLLPIAITAAVSLLKPFFVSRYFLIALPGYALTLGVVLQWVARRSRWLLAFAVVAVLVMSLPAHNRIWGSVAVREDWRGAESYVTANYRPGDGIVVPVWHDVHAFGYYAARDPRLAIVAPLADLPDGPWTVAYWPAPSHGHRRTPALNAFARSHTIWIVLRTSDPTTGLQTNWQSPSLNALRDAMRLDSAHLSSRSFRGIVVYRHRPATSVETTTRPATTSQPSEPVEPSP
jgi:mannosyltransferase